MYSILARPDPVPCGQGVAFDYLYSLHPSLVHLLLCLHLDSSLVSYCASFFLLLLLLGKRIPPSAPSVCLSLGLSRVSVCLGIDKRGTRVVNCRAMSPYSRAEPFPFSSSSFFPYFFLSPSSILCFLDGWVECARTRSLS